MKGICALEDIETELVQSHIIPKFIFDYFKSTGSKYMRTYENPNKRIQDGIKEYLLGASAEQKFSSRERWFANNIFFPYLKDNKTTFDYDDNFAYCLISILWRVLINQNRDPSVKNEESLKFLSKVEEEWKMFLKDFKYPTNYNDLNIFLTDRVTSHNTTGINVDLYFTRIIDATIITNKNNTTVAVYVKFLRFAIWSVVKGKPSDCDDLKVNFLKGTLKVPQKINDEFIGGFFQSRIQEIDNKPKANEKQQEVIAKEIVKNEIDFWKSDVGKSMINDFKNKKRN